MMAAAGTCDYVATIPGSIADGCFECRAATREPVARTGDDLRDSRLVGFAPLIRVSAAGPAAGATPGRPRIPRSRITLTALEQRLSAVAAVAFHVDKALADAFRSGDELYIVRTSVGGLGLSVIRDGELVAAVGGVTAVRLGRGVIARIPRRLIEEAEAVIREDSDVQAPRLPVEVIVGDSRSILDRGHRTLEAYDVDVVHGFSVGLPGRQECCAIYDRRACPDVAATASAMLMDDGHSLTMRRW